MTKQRRDTKNVKFPGVPLCRYSFMQERGSVQSLRRVRLFVIPWTAASQVSLSITNCQNLVRLMSIKLVMPPNHLILCHPLLLLLSVFPRIRVFSSESVLHIRYPKYWSFSISPSNEYSGLVSFRIDWFELLAVQGTLKSLFQHHSSKASILLSEPSCRRVRTSLLQPPGPVPSFHPATSSREKLIQYHFFALYTLWGEQKDLNKF